MSVNKDNFIDVNIKHHTKLFPFPSISSTIDQMEQFEKERSESTKYRLVLTINPYCSNILFNAVTEIVQNEGTDKPSELRIASTTGLDLRQKGILGDDYVIKGKTNDVTNVDMVRNTEYANGDKPFVYHCGYDIFNNHILRNQTFKLVNPIVDGESFKHKNTKGRDNEKSIKENFNTIRDFMRYADGKEITLRKRNDLNTIIGTNSNEGENDARHLYLKDDILEYIDSINANLNEQNGWFGFYNRSSIPSSEYVEEDERWQDLKISKIFNDEKSMSCGFIEMYPDSTLFSFNPKYNKFQNREEHNWDICITYPCENDYDKLLVSGKFGGEFVFYQWKSSDSDYEVINFYTVDDATLPTQKVNNQNFILFNGLYYKWDSGEYKLINIIETYTPPNNKIADYIKIQEQGDDFNALLLCSHELTNGTSEQPIIMFRSYVKHNLTVGDEIKLFYSTNPRTGFNEIKDKLFKVVNIGNLENKEQEYYFYINDVEDILNEIEGFEFDTKNFYFRYVKVENNINCKYYYRKFKKLPNFKFKKQELTEEDDLGNYIQNNCYDDNGNMFLFSKEQYPLAFSRTIYGDSKTQIVFTDTIDIDKLKDNLNRPITELFVTIIKRNKGHDLWYNETKTEEDLKNIEFSHCFGTVNSGIYVHGEWTDDNTDNFILKYRKEIGDVSLLEKDDDYPNNDITIDDNEFYGDVVELNCYNMVETILSDVYFRFNTEQREHDFKQNEINCGNFIYDEIETDDYDYHGFVCKEYNMSATNDDKPPIKRPEGYFYKAHYPIMVRQFGEMKQGSHKEIIVSSCKPVQANGLFVEVVSSLRSGVSSGDVIYLYDNSDNDFKPIPLFVNDVLSNVRFLLSPMVYSTDSNYINVYKMVEGLLHSDKKTITQEDIDEGYSWVDENGAVHIASDAVMNDNNEVIIPTDVNKEVFDYSNPKYVLRIRNKEIPYYAYKVSSNLYLWRDLLTVGDSNAVDLPEYPFANGHFYVNKEINFFLDRQDPRGDNGLYSYELIPNDIAGNIKKENIYEYKDITYSTC